MKLNKNEKRNSILDEFYAPLCRYFVYYMNILMTIFLTIFRRFRTTFRRFSKIVSKAWRTFPNIFRRLLTIAEDDWRSSEDVPVLHSTLKCNLKGQKRSVSKMISPHLRLSYLFYQFDTIRYFTGVYIYAINVIFTNSSRCISALYTGSLRLLFCFPIPTVILIVG